MAKFGPQHIKGSAIFSACDLYRYELRRVWDTSLPPFCVIGLNPSTADARKNDPTVHRQIKRASLNHFGELIMLNVGAGRNTKPQDWLKMEDPYGPRNMHHIKKVFREVRRRHGLVVAGWGTHAPKYQVRRIVELAKRLDIRIHCLGMTKDGSPVHPLYVSYLTRPTPWNEYGSSPGAWRYESNRVSPSAKRKRVLLNA